MINCIIRHELRQNLARAKNWYYFAAVQAVLAFIFNWLLQIFLSRITTLSGIRHGITEEVIHPYYAWFALLYIFFIPMLSTQAICAEKSRGTIINYYCAPLSAWQFVLAKFLSLNLLLLTSMVIATLAPLALTIAGTLDWGQFFASILGVYLLLSAATSIGISCAFYAKNAGRSNVLIFLALLFATLLEWAAQFTGRPALLLQKFGLLNPLKGFLAGVISTQNITYYLLIIIVCLCLAINTYNRERHEN